MTQIRLGFIIQARTGSARLPYKIIKDFHEGATILDIILARLKKNFGQYPIILATSHLKDDHQLKGFAELFDIEFHQGSEKNVLERFISAAEKFQLTHIVRVCADNPFLNTAGILSLIEALDSPEIDYISFQNSSGVPTIKTHLGLFAEIVSLNALLVVDKATRDLVYLEHVTNYIYLNREQFDVKLLTAPGCVVSRDDIRLTIDDIDDFENLSDLYSRSSKIVDDLETLIDCIDQQPSLKKVMTNNILKYTK